MALQQEVYVVGKLQGLQHPEIRDWNHLAQEEQRILIAAVERCLAAGYIQIGPAARWVAAHDVVDSFGTPKETGDEQQKQQEQQKP